MITERRVAPPWLLVLDPLVFAAEAEVAGTAAASPALPASLSNGPAPATEPDVHDTMEYAGEPGPADQQPDPGRVRPRPGTGRAP